MSSVTRISMPDETQVPPGPRRALLVALHDLYGDAGKPTVRQISAWIQERDDLRGTLSRQAVSELLRGITEKPRWLNVEAFVRVLAENKVGRKPDMEDVVERILVLWRIADDFVPLIPIPKPKRKPRVPAPSEVATSDPLEPAPTPDSKPFTIHFPDQQLLGQTDWRDGRVQIKRAPERRPNAYDDRRRR
ncbi:hypothetical protein [Nocardia gipuzkoensis]